jgi:hypothetical protein
MVLKPFALILCLPVAEHHLTNKYCQTGRDITTKDNADREVRQDSPDGTARKRQRGQDGQNITAGTGQLWQDS